MVTLKIYILVAYLPFFILFLILKNVNLIKNPFAKVMLVSVFFMGSIFGFVRVAKQHPGRIERLCIKRDHESIKNYQTNYENQADFVQSNFSLGVEFDGSTASLAKMAPAAIVATLFRPFIWESKKPSTLLSSFGKPCIHAIYHICFIEKLGYSGF